MADQHQAPEVPAEQAAQAAEEPAQGEGDEGSKIDWLRQRGVEIDLAEDREAERVFDASLVSELLSCLVLGES